MPKRVPRPDSSRSNPDYTLHSEEPIIGLALALLTIAVTATAVVGLADPNEESWRRRFLIMSMAENFTAAAASLLAGCAIAGVIGIFGQITTDLDKFHPSNTVLLFVIPAVAALLWLCVRLSYRRLGQITLSDRDALLKEKGDITKQVDAYTTTSKKLSAELTSFDLNPDSSTLAVFIHTVVMSLAVVVVASGICASMIFLPGSREGGLWNRFWGIFIGTGGLSLISMLLTMAPWMWAHQIWKTTRKRVAPWFLALMALLFTTPLWITVPLVLTGLLADPEFREPLWTGILLVVLVIAPGVFMLTMKRSWSWRAVGVLQAYRNNEDLRISLKKRLSVRDLREQQSMLNANNGVSDRLGPLVLDNSAGNSLSDIASLLTDIRLELRNNPAIPRGARQVRGTTNSYFRKARSHGGKQG